MKQHRLTVRHAGMKGFNFSYAATTYNIYPWIGDGKHLLRVLRLPSTGKPVVAILRRDPGGLAINVWTSRSLTRTELSWVRNTLSWALGLDESYKTIRRLARHDRVLKAAWSVNSGIRPKRYTDIFESICGAICAQNVDFRRLYQMMRSLAVAFGPHISIKHVDYYAFPSAQELASASELQLRRCKVGYRARALRQAAKFIASHPEVIDRTKLKTLTPENAIDDLCSIPGVGRYSAAIVLSAGIGRSDVFHLDSFTRLILQTFYLNGKAVDDQVLTAFVGKHWPSVSGNIANLLTTNTHVWARRLGVDGFRPSQARLPPSPTNARANRKETLRH